MFYMIYKLTCPKPAHFLFAQMAFLRSFLQMFIALGMYRVTLFLEQNQASCAIHLIQGHYLGENLGKTFGILQKLKYALQSQCLQQQLEIVIKHMQHGFAIVFLAGFTAFISKSYAFCWCVVQTGWLACQLKHQTRFVHSTIPSRYRDKLEV